MLVATDFGLVGDDTFDNTAAFAALISAWTALTDKPQIFFPAGRYRYSASPNFAYKGMRIAGEGKLASSLHFVGSGRAVNIDASAFGNSPVMGVELADMEIIGTSNCSDLLYVQNVSHMNVSNIGVREANAASGIGANLLWTVASRFENFTCSINEHEMAAKPFVGIRLGTSPSRNLRSTDNTFINTIIEGPVIGAQVLAADQTTFVGGTLEACQSHGIAINSLCKMTSLIGVAMEANGSSDIIDGGYSTIAQNCYSGRKILLLGGGRGGVVRSGVHERIEIQAGRQRAVIEDLDYNHFATGAGGIFDSGTGTVKRNLYDVDSGIYTS